MSPAVQWGKLQSFECWIRVKPSCLSHGGQMESLRRQMRGYYSHEIIQLSVSPWSTRAHRGIILHGFTRNKMRLTQVLIITTDTIIILTVIIIIIIIIILVTRRSYDLPFHYSTTFAGVWRGGKKLHNTSNVSYNVPRHTSAKGDLRLAGSNRSLPETTLFLSPLSVAHILRRAACANICVLLTRAVQFSQCNRPELMRMMEAFVEK